MGFRYACSLIFAIMTFAALSFPVHAAGTIQAISTAKFSTDPVFEGLWQYTVEVSWNLESHDPGHLDVFLGLRTFGGTCSGTSVVFPVPAGVSSGIDSFDGPCEVEYGGEFLCKTDPSLKIGGLGHTVKFEPNEGICETDTEGSGVFHFFTAVAPGIPGEHTRALAIKHGQEVTFANVQGQLPYADGVAETGLVLINEFLVRPPPGEREFVEVFNATNDPIDLTGWEIIIDDQFIIPLGDTIPPGGHRVDSTIVPFAKIDFDFFPGTGDSIPSGTEVNFAYFDEGVIFDRVGGEMCGGNYEVYANDGQPLGFGSSPNVVTTCPDGIASDISEGQGFGYIEAYFSIPLRQVCIDVDPVRPFDRAVLRAYGDDDVFLGAVFSTPGVRQTLCFQAMTEEIWSVQFSGSDTLFCRFDNFCMLPAPPPFAEGKPSPFTASSMQQNGEEEEDFVPDKGGTIVLVDDNGATQDSVGYGNQGGAPIPAPEHFYAAGFRWGGYGERRKRLQRGKAHAREQQ
jgi:hypothetical protein